MRHEGSLEKALESSGYRVEWREFPSGPPLFEALNAGAIDLGHSGDAPLIFAQAKKVPFLYVAQSKASPESAGILVPQASPLHAVADLKGRRLAFAKGSSSHYLVARALTAAGLSLADITPVYLQPPDARAAFQNGSIDAWAIWDPFYAAGEIDGHGRILTSGAHLSPHREFYFGRKDFVESHPELIDKLIEVLQATGQRAFADPSGTAAFLAPKLGLPLPVVEKVQHRNQRYEVQPMRDEVLTEQQLVADTFLKLGLIPEKLDVRAAVFHPPAR